MKKEYTYKTLKLIPTQNNNEKRLFWAFSKSKDPKKFIYLTEKGDKVKAMGVVPGKIHISLGYIPGANASIYKKMLETHDKPWVNSFRLNRVGSKPHEDFTFAITIKTLKEM